ncbi:MAG: PAS domain S-box protein [Syntrophales bacterium]|jgi:PAS domain S-box-containing protein
MDKPLRILILEDRPSDAELMEFELKEAGFTFISKRVMTEDAFAHELKEFCPDLILSDYDLPQYTGFLALAEAKKKCPDVPFILVTGAIGEDRAIEILTHGAKDYVMKSRLHRLVPAVHRALAEAEEHKARKNAEEKLHKAHRTLEKKIEKRTAQLQTEIAERKKMEEALRESEQRYRELVQSSPDAVIVHRDGMFLFANPAALRLYGADSIEQLQAKTIIDLTHPDDRAAIELRMKQGQDGERLPLRESRLLRLDGQAIPVEAVGSTVYYQGRRAVQIIIRDITGRRRVEEALAQEKLFSDAVIDSLPGIFFVIDEKGRLIHWNRNVEKISGYSREDLSSLDIMTFIAEEDRDIIVNKLQEGFVTGAATTEAYLAGRSGHKVPFYLTGTRAVIRDKQYLIGMGIDVTERKRTGEQIAKLTCLYAALSRVNETIIRVRDVASLYHEVCRIVSEECTFPLVWIGQVNGELVVPVAWYGPAGDYLKEIKVETKGELGQGPTGTSIRENRAVINDDFVTNPATSPWREKADSYGFRASAAFPLRRQGSPTASLTLYAPDPGAFDEEQVGLLESLSADISYALDALDHEQLRERAEEALRESEDKFAGLYSSMVEGVALHKIIYDTSGEAVDYIISDVNHSYESITGLRKDMIVGKRATEVYGTSEAPFLPVFARVALCGKPEVFEAHFSPLRKYFAISAFSPAKGQFATVFQDISERKQAEEELNKHTAQLEELNRELESFSYSVSHDLRAPLRAIDGYARLILKKQGDKFDKDTLNKFNVIRNSTHLMGQLIDDLLTFSRLGRQHMSISELDMDALMREAWKELEVINPDRNMRLTVKTIPAGYGDRALIKQVCVNLLSNAIKFTKYRADADIEAGGYANEKENVYFVRDNGVGFDMAYYDKLFGVFQRLHSAEDFEGTGVGLAIVQRIVHRHGGRVWADGKVNEGACFYFALRKQEEMATK